MKDLQRRHEDIICVCQRLLDEHGEVKKFLSGFGKPEPCTCDGCEAARRLMVGNILEIRRCNHDHNNTGVGAVGDRRGSGSVGFGRDTGCGPVLARREDMAEVACPPKQLVPRAFQTEWQGVRCIVFSSSASRARYATYKAAKDAGWNPVLTEIKVCRVPFYDNAKTYTGDAVKENWCYSAEYLS